MKSTITTVRMQSDGTLVRINPDGTEEEVVVPPLAPISDEAAMASALCDPHAQPLTETDFARLKRVPRIKTLRRALGLTQEEFAERYHIPLETIHAWEQGYTEPDQLARAYLRVIAHDPDGTRRALQPALH
jgi:putative transcriptional regulator